MLNPEHGRLSRRNSSFVTIAQGQIGAVVINEVIGVLVHDTSANPFRLGLACTVIPTATYAIFRLADWSRNWTNHFRRPFRH